MMKRFTVFCIAVLLLIATGCNASGQPQETTLTESDPVTTMGYYDFYDWEMKHNPTESDIARITSEMKFSDVVEILGKPHKSGPLSGLYSVGYQTVEGNKYYMVVLSPDDSKPFYENIMKSGVVSEPKKWPEGIDFETFPPPSQE